MSNRVTYAIVRIEHDNTDRAPADILQDVLDADPSVELSTARTVTEDDDWTDQPHLYWP